MAHERRGAALEGLGSSFLSQMPYDTPSREEGSFGFGAIAVCPDERLRPAGLEKLGDNVTIALTDRRAN